MRMRRYQVRDQVEIDASVELSYATATDPQIVPLYVPEISRIVLVKKLSERLALVKSYLRVGKLTIPCLYRYHYRPPTHYSGVQERGWLIRGYFSFLFRRRGGRTIVSHVEGILSPIPGLARAVGFIYFRVLAGRGAGVKEELATLRNLVESRQSPSAIHPTPSASARRSTSERVESFPTPRD